EDGKDPVNPSFDLLLSSYRNGSGTWNFDVAIKDGQAEFWFPINKDFGPLKIEQIGVRYFTENNGGQDEHRLGILIDGSAEVAGFMAQVDDLMVSFPLLDPFDFKGVDTLGWQFDMAGLAISYDGPSFSIAGALRKETSYAYFPQGTDFADTYPSNDIITVNGTPSQFGDDLPNGMTAAKALKYAEYQGLCTITTETLGLSAVGAFARVPNADGTGFVSLFVIAALDMPLGGPPFFFVTGLLGGLGLNRQLPIPNIVDVPQHLFIQTLGGDLAKNPMGALKLIKTQFPIQHGSFWFAVGLKFTSFQIIESRAVLFIKIDTGFTIGIVALSAMSLPSKEFNIGYVELALLAYYSSEEQVLWVQAQLTDASYIFSKSCRLTGGFALVTWFKTGEFLLSLGGYHPRFKAPSYYPVVPRIGFNWKPISCIVIKGGAYFTLCSSAVMLGGGLDAAFKKGRLSAGFRMGLDVLVVFDPFYYDFEMYIEIYVRYKTWLGTLSASLGARLQIEGPKMRGVATISLAFIEFKVKFGSQDDAGAEGISGKEFLNKHIRQLAEGQEGSSPGSDWRGKQSGTTPNQGEWMDGSILMGTSRKDSDPDNPPDGTTDEQRWKLEPEFDIMLSHKFPATQLRFFHPNYMVDIDDDPIESADVMDLAPMLGPQDVESITSVDLFKDDPTYGWTDAAGVVYNNADFVTVESRQSFFPDTIWSANIGTNGKLIPKKSAGEQLKFLSSYVFSGRCYKEDGTEDLDLDDKVEPCEIDHYIPLRITSSAYNSIISILGAFELINLDLQIGTNPDYSTLYGALMGSKTNEEVQNNKLNFLLKTSGSGYGELDKGAGYGGRNI
ncbi:MAG: hypothetical protein CXX81_07540, partial [Methanobacteriota archaeon]